MCIETPIVPPETRFTQKYQLYYEADERGNPIILVQNKHFTPAEFLLK